MTAILSQNTQAILLLTAPLIAGGGKASPELLSPGEYKRLAKHLLGLRRTPADLLSAQGQEVIQACNGIADADRLGRLLARGFLLTQAVERWQARAIWVVSRADPEYPRLLKIRLREDAPAVIYGCGEIRLVDSGGLAIVGSRHVDDALLDYTVAIGRLAAKAAKTVVSGGAKGIDQASMRGALEAGGRAVGVLANHLERGAMNREHRGLLLDGHLLLMSPYDPSSGFNVGNAMQRNKLIYALAEAALVVNSDLNKGGTWAGAKEQLDKFRFVTLYVRSTGEISPGLEALKEKGALPWPCPEDMDAFERVFKKPRPDGAMGEQTALGLSLLHQIMETPRSSDEESVPFDTTCTETPGSATDGLTTTANAADSGKDDFVPSAMPAVEGDPLDVSDTAAALAERLERKPKDVLFDSFRTVVEDLLTTPMKDKEIADVLDITPAQTKAWLDRLVAEGSIKKLPKRPVHYVMDRDLLDELRNG